MDALAIVQRVLGAKPVMSLPKDRSKLPITKMLGTIPFSLNILVSKDLDLYYTKKGAVSIGPFEGAFCPFAVAIVGSMNPLLGMAFVGVGIMKSSTKEISYDDKTYVYVEDLQVSAPIKISYDKKQDYWQFDKDEYKGSVYYNGEKTNYSVSVIDYLGNTYINLDELEYVKEQIVVENSTTETQTITPSIIFVTKEHLLHLEWKESYITDDILFDLNRTLKAFDINTNQRIRHFLTQISHESGRGLWVKENGNNTYMLATYGTFETNPKMGKDWKYRGGGYIQLSTEGNYEYFYNWLRDNEGIDDPKIMSEGYTRVAEKYPWLTAGVWWDQNNMNAKVDQGGTIAEISNRVNGGSNGLEDRLYLYELALEIFPD